MNVLEVIALHPGAADVLSAYGLNCHGCAFGSLDSLEAGALSHGLTQEDIRNIVTDLKDLLASAPPKPKTFTLTASAAEALLAIARQEGKTSCLLRVVSDGAGGFCMEFGDKAGAGDLSFTAEGVADVSLAIAPEVLQRVGGGAVDFREGRFKLDLPPAPSCACANGGTCGCKA